MKYALLLYGDREFEEAWARASDDERAKVYAEHGKYAEQLGDHMIGGEELAISPMATTLRRNGDDFVITDGPFAEVTEHLGGYYLIEAADLDEAIALARGCPSDVTEIRPIVELPPEFA